MFPYRPSIKAPDSESSPHQVSPEPKEEGFEDSSYKLMQSVIDEHKLPLHVHRPRCLHDESQGILHCFFSNDVIMRFMLQADGTWEAISPQIYPKMENNITAEQVKPYKDIFDPLGVIFANKINRLQLFKKT